MRSVCPLFGIRKLSAIREHKCTASTGIAVGTSTVVRCSEEVRYCEGPLSEVALYVIFLTVSRWNGRVGGGFRRSSEKTSPTEPIIY